MYEGFRKFMDIIFKGLGIIVMVGVLVFSAVAFKSCQKVYLDDKTEVRR